MNNNNNNNNDNTHKTIIMRARPERAWARRVLRGRPGTCLLSSFLFFSSLCLFARGKPNNDTRESDTRESVEQFFKPVFRHSIEGAFWIDLGCPSPS